MQGGDLKVDLIVYDPNEIELHRSPQATFAWYDNGDIKIPGLFYHLAFLRQISI
jgi:hypothetical protein